MAIFSSYVSLPEGKIFQDRFWLVVWNILGPWNFMTFHILGIRWTTEQLTFIFFGWNHQPGHVWYYRMIFDYFSIFDRMFLLIFCNILYKMGIHCFSYEYNAWEHNRNALTSWHALKWENHRIKWANKWNDTDYVPGISWNIHEFPMEMVFFL